MNWYKFSQEIHDFQDRTQVNKRIRSLEAIAEVVDYSGRLVFQTARGARRVIDQIANHKKMSSFEDLQDMLKEASMIALDNPKKFQKICLMVSEKLLRKINSLKVERKQFVDRNKPKKGLIN